MKKKGSLKGGAKYGYDDKDFRVRGGATLKNAIPLLPGEQADDAAAQGYGNLEPFFWTNAEVEREGFVTKDYLEQNFPLPRASLRRVFQLYQQNVPLEQHPAACGNVIDRPEFKEAWATAALQFSTNCRGFFNSPHVDVNLLDATKEHMWSVKCLVDVAPIIEDLENPALQKQKTNAAKIAPKLWLLLGILKLKADANEGQTVTEFYNSIDKGVRNVLAEQFVRCGLNVGMLDVRQYPILLGDWFQADDDGGGGRGDDDGSDGGGRGDDGGSDGGGGGFDGDSDGDSGRDIGGDIGGDSGSDSSSNDSKDGDERNEDRDQIPGVEPVVEPVEPVVEPVEPVVEPVGPVVEPVGPVVEPVGPVQQPPAVQLALQQVVIPPSIHPVQLLGGVWYNLGKTEYAQNWSRPRMFTDLLRDFVNTSPDLVSEAVKAAVFKRLVKYQGNVAAQYCTLVAAKLGLFLKRSHKGQIDHKDFFKICKNKCTDYLNTPVVQDGPLERWSIRNCGQILCTVTTETTGTKPDSKVLEFLAVDHRTLNNDSKCCELIYQTCYRKSKLNRFLKVSFSRRFKNMLKNQYFKQIIESIENKQLASQVCDKLRQYVYFVNSKITYANAVDAVDEVQASEMGAEVYFLQDFPTDIANDNKDSYVAFAIIEPNTEIGNGNTVVKQGTNITANVTNIRYICRRNDRRRNSSRMKNLGVLVALFGLSFVHNGNNLCTHMATSGDTRASQLKQLHEGTTTSPGPPSITGCETYGWGLGMERAFSTPPIQNNTWSRDLKRAVYPFAVQDPWPIYVEKYQRVFGPWGQLNPPPYRRIGRYDPSSDFLMYRSFLSPSEIISRAWLLCHRNLNTRMVPPETRSRRM